MIGNSLLLGDDGYQISRSVRLRSSASASFSRTPGSNSTSQTTRTFSAWVKRGVLSASGRFTLFYQGAPAGSGQMFLVEFFNDSIRVFYDGALTYSLTTASVFRDPSAFYHVVVQSDTSQATAANRTVVFINGVAQTISGTQPIQNYTAVNGTTSVHSLGQVASINYFDGLLTEINFIDGQALTPSSFGETDAITGVWKPKKYTGTYGTNGFFLNFSDNSSNTATTIGKDYSGNGNNWTPNNISVTAGSTYDSMLDVPTMWADGGNGRGNYATFNPLETGSGIPGTLSNANLTISGTSVLRRATMAFPLTGKWYCEMFVNAVGSAVSFAYDSRGQGSATQFIQYNSAGTKNINGTTTSYGASFTTNDVIGMAVDADSGVVTFYKNNASQGDLSFSSASMSGVSAFATVYVDTGGASASINFGQRPFTYTPPSGFKALNTQNLPEPTIKKGNAYFDATTYTGTGSAQSIVNSGAMQPDLVWTKSRSAVNDHILMDSVRGLSVALFSNLTNAEVTDSTRITSLNANGFTLGTSNSTNQNAATFVGWQWKEGATQGFDIVTYTGNGTAGRTISHSLGVTPAMTIVKDRSNGTNGWPVWHRAYAGTQTLYLESTTGLLTRDRVTAVSSTTFTVGSHTEVNNNGNTYVAYLFSEVAGFSKFGSYTGNGSADGPFCFTGFQPRFVMIKRTDTAEAWTIVDTSRTTTNKNSVEYLIPNSSGAEFTDTNSEYDILSNGFKLRDAGSLSNASGGTYVYAAFASNPFKYSLAR